MTPSNAQSPGGAGVIHDLAYRRYDGARRPPAWRVLVIARYALATQWRQRGVKLSLLAAMVLGALAAAFGGAKWGFTSMVANEAGGAATDLARVLGDGDAEAAVWALRVQLLPVILLALQCGAPAISADLNAGAFQFHFSRPVTVPQYLLGRMLSATAWAALVTVSTLALMCGVRAGVSGRALPVLWVFAKSLGVVLARVVSLAAVSLGASSLTRRKGIAQAMFAALVLGPWLVSGILAGATGRRWVGALDVTGATEKLLGQLLGTVDYAGLGAAVPALSLLAWTAAFLGLAAWRLARAEVVRG